MALTSRFGKPDIFLTFTSNPKWKEITDNLAPGQTATDRPDIVARVFRLKLKELKKDVIDRGLFGRVAAFIYTVEKKEARDLEILGRLHELGPVDPRTVPYYKYPEHFTFVKVTFFQTLTQLLFPVIRKVEEEGRSQQ